jgi:hypothetical protein
VLVSQVFLPGLECLSATGKGDVAPLAESGGSDAILAACGLQVGASKQLQNDARFALGGPASLSLQPVSDPAPVALRAPSAGPETETFALDMFPSFYRKSVSNEIVPLEINPPYAIGAFKVLAIFSGQNPATENFIKPAAIYQRHNREWTPREVRLALECCGFEVVAITTNASRLSPLEQKVLNLARKEGLVKLQNEYYGPEIFAIRRKIRHLTVRSHLAKEQQWPEWLYSSFEGYRKRAKA